ncbi:MAG: reverse transcriptase/maturase family protein [Rhodanobacter sp.]
MTKPCQPIAGRADGSQVREIAESPSDNAWNVNFDNGNANRNNQNNRGRVVAVCSRVSSECQGVTNEVSFRDLHGAWQRARQHKVPSQNQLQFEANWIDGLLDLQERINAGKWEPSQTTCFIAVKPKARQIHAPDFADRIVHHWLVPQLNAIYEPGFIHHSYANRRGKGTHAAVAALRKQVRQVHSGQGSGWYLQLDIRNFFNSISRPTLWCMLKERMQRRGVPIITQRVAHALLRRSVENQGVVHRSTPAERTRVPAYKRLENAAPGFGLPIGNLSSQFFANVYLDALDQFVTHTLKASRYLRYVDDFVLVHQSREQLEQWLVRITDFLRDTLKLELKDDIRLRPLTAGIDFLGYVVYPTHTRVRSRVVRHAEGALKAWKHDHQVQGGMFGTPAEFRNLSSIWASYQGQFKHADSWRLQQLFLARHPWLAPLTDSPRRFSHQIEGKRITVRIHP